MSLILAIDPDKRGGLVLNQNGALVKLAPMPLVTSAKSKDLFDLGAIKRLFLDWKPEVVVIEKQAPLPAYVEKRGAKPCVHCGQLADKDKVSLGGSLANWSRGYALALFESMCAVLGIKYVVVAPATWQSEVLTDVRTTDTKQAALVVAKRLWPDQNWLATERSRKPWQGLVDAACISEFGRRRGF